MPIRIQPNRPYYPRHYLPRGAGQARAAAQPRGGGAKGAFGGGVDTSSTGNVGGDLAKAVINTMLQNRQNAAANAIMNTQTPPRAGAVGPVVDPATGQITSNITPTVGTAPQTGGMGELQMRQQMQQQDLADQLQKAKIASELALAQQRTGRGGGGGGGGVAGGNAARWQQYLGGVGGPGGFAAAGKKAGKPAPYEPGSIDPNTDPNADKFPVVQADFDAQYGKGAYAKVAPRLGNVVPDDKGNYVVQDDKGNTIVSLPPSDANYWLARVNAARVRSGQQPMLTDKFPSANPNSGQPAGSDVNPFKPANQLEARSLPYKSFFIDPNTGQVGQKLPEEKQAPADQKTSQADTSDQGQQVADTSDQGQQVASAMQGPQGPPPALAGLVPGSTPGSFDLGQPSTGGLPQGTTLADAIARARAQDQLTAAA
jgi:LysM repeat protein